MLKVQKIRSCVQCGDVLAKKCDRCKAHSNRKPRVIEYYDWPEILAISPCGCIKIACQLPGCHATMWRLKSKNRGGMSISKNFFCSVAHTSKFVASQRDKRQTVPCAYCGKLVVKKAFALKTWKESYCNQTCHFLQRAKRKHEAREASAKIQVMVCYCPAHRGEIVEQTPVRGTNYLTCDQGGKTPSFYKLIPNKVQALS